MNRNRWMAALLLASWTLNIAFVTAWFSQKICLPGGFWSNSRPDLEMEEPPPPPPGALGEGFLEETAPLHQQRKLLMQELGEAFDADQLDSARIHELGDSLSEVRAQLQSKLVERMTRMHDRLSPEDRHLICRRMMRHLNDEPRGLRGHRPFDEK